MNIFKIKNIARLVAKFRHALACEVNNRHDVIAVCFLALQSKPGIKRGIIIANATINKPNSNLATLQLASAHRHRIGPPSAQMAAECPENSIPYNTTGCFCSPGYYSSYSSAKAICSLFSLPPGEGVTEHSAVGNNPEFLLTIFPFDSISKVNHPNALILEITAFALLTWLVFCAAVRIGKLRGGRSFWFKIRWWISRLDFCYDTKHWLNDRRVVMKRRTELGGTFSIACLILFLGLFAVLLYQIITKRTIVVHRVKPSNGQDYISFVNDFEFNITTISSMSCSHLRDLGTFMTETPGITDFRNTNLSTYANYSCHNTSMGPMISIKCDRCKVPPDSFYIPWRFVDLPNHPAASVAFKFNLTIRDHRNSKKMSYTSGIVQSGMYTETAPKTFRGPDANVLVVHLSPQKYFNRHNLSIIQPIFHDFLPGSYFSDSSRLQASLQNSNDGLVNTALFVKFLSDYILEVDEERISGTVSFIASIGGVFIFSFVIFFYLLAQCEFRFKKLRNEDIVFWNTISRNRARRNWEKLRKYVMYTYGSDLDGCSITGKQHRSGMLESFSNFGSRHRRTDSQKDSISICMDKTKSASTEINVVPETSVEKVPRH